METGPNDKLKRRAPGMQDVARRAGVSHQTVSRVINSHPHVSAATKERVQQAISELGYRRNSAARALVTSRSGTIGVALLGSALFGPASTLLSVETAARRAGYFVSMVSLRATDIDSLSASFEHFMDQAVEGIIVIAPQVNVLDAAQAVAINVPLVVIASDLPKRLGLHRLSVDQYAGARMAVRHLAELGHHNIAHLAGPSDWFDARARVRGWRAELTKQQLPTTKVLHGDWSAESGYNIGLRLLDQHLPDAVFAANDQMALGLIRALTEAGVPVPQGISVVGFDDVEGAAYFNPPLTTIRQDFEALGEQCIDLLVRVLATEYTPAPKPITPTLIVRGSTTTSAAQQPASLGLSGRTM
jgi:DNA-binding LacI/PurR family transcriptional regulator